MLTLLTEESKLIVKLCKAVDFEKDLSWMGTGGFVNAIEELWQTACHIGYTHGLEDAEARSSQTSPVLAVSVATTQANAVDTPAAAPSMSAAPPPPNDAQIERVLLETVPWDVRKKGGKVLQQCIRDLWDKAASIGLNYTEEKYVRARQEGFQSGKEWGIEQEKARAAVGLEKELEKERVWGFDVGWKLCSEQLQSRTLQASLILPPHSLPCAAPAAASLDWAEDAASLPIHPPHSTTSPSPPRDFSALHTGVPQPFASLQRRRRRAPRTPTSSTRPTTSSLQNNPPKKDHYPTIRRTIPAHSNSPSSIRLRPPPSFSATSDTPATRYLLDWDQDPRLQDLGRALTALGWARL